MIAIRQDKTASFDVDPQRGFTPLCPDEPVEEMLEAGPQLIDSGVELESA